MRSAPLPLVPLPEGWPDQARTGLLHAIALARFALLRVRGWAADSRLMRARLRAENDRLRSEVAMLAEELRIKDARMARLAPARRPHYVPPDRLAILELRAARGWSAAVTARRFLLTDATIAGWTGRCQAEGPDELVRPQVPVNRYPDFVAHLLHELRATLPSMGRRRVADVLARAGLHLGKTTVQRLLRKPAPPAPSPVPPTKQKAASGRTVIARYPNHVWSADLTVMPTLNFWVPWFPYALPQRWPSCWWILVVVDHFSRAIAHVEVFRSEPTSAEVCRELDRAVANATGPPKYFVTDQGTQFRAEYRAWCAERGIPPRFGAVGKYGSIAVTERLVRTLKDECLRRLIVPLRESELLDELEAYSDWYNAERPHAFLHGSTPAEIRDGRRPARGRARLEVRPRYPARRGTRGTAGTAVKLDIRFHRERRNLPVVRLRAA